MFRGFGLQRFTLGFVLLAGLAPVPALVSAKPTEPAELHPRAASGIHEQIPYFARRFDLECAACHVGPPKLNEAGEAFVRGNYRLEDRSGRPTLPLAIWVSSRADRSPATQEAASDLRAYVNRLEVISGGPVVVPWLAYFVEWRPVSFELRQDGTLRDRSGRFEDLFLTAQWDQIEVSVGQFRQMAQVDVSRRLGVNEPRYFSSGLSGRGEAEPRIKSLRSFSLAGRAPTLRIGWIEEMGVEWEWTTYVSAAIPGEISVPLTREARAEASHEIEMRPKGVFLESFVRRGMTSYGAHLFLDSRNRYLFGAVTTGSSGSVLWTAAAGGAGMDGRLRGRAMAEIEWVPTPFIAVGGRWEDQVGAPAALVPYLNLSFPGTTHTFRLTLEHREQSGTRGTFLELGALF